MKPAVFIVAALVAATYLVQQTDGDPWWHLATGRWIVEHHAIPNVDPFSFTVAGAPWRAVDWLADLLLYGSYTVAGYAGVGLLTALAAFAMLALLGLTLCELASPWTAAALVACVGVMVQGRYSMARPMTFGALALCATLYLCGRNWHRPSRSLLLVAPLALVWCTLHPSAILGPLIVGIFAGAALVNRHPARKLWMLAMLSTLLLVAPWAGALVDVARAHDQATLALALTTEWARPKLGDRELWLPSLLTLASLVACRRRALPFIGCAVVGVVLASRYTRNLYEGILLASPLWALAIARIESWLAARHRLLPALAVGIALPAAHLGLAPGEFNRRFGVGPADGAVPLETLNVLGKLPPGHLMNDCTAGGWLIWLGIPVYCDGRAVALYRQADVERLFLPLYSSVSVIDATADRLDIHYALARFDSDFQDTLMRAPQWVPVAYDRRYSLFVRRRYASDESLEELRYVDDASWLGTWYAAVAADPARSQRLEADVIRAAKLCPNSRTLRSALHYLAGAQPALAQRLKAALTAALR